MRYLPLTAEDRAEMLAKVGVGKIDDLFADVPAGKLLPEPPALPPHKSELEKLMTAEQYKDYVATLS